MADIFLDPHRLTDDEQDQLIAIFKTGGFELLKKFLVFKAATLRDRAMVAEKDEETREFKWGAAAVLSLVADIQTLVMKKRVREEAKIEKALIKSPPKKAPKRAFGPDSVQI